MPTLWGSSPTEHNLVATTTSTTPDPTEDSQKEEQE
jgi:hypothetical protein